MIALLASAALAAGLTYEDGAVRDPNGAPLTASDVATRFGDTATAGKIAQIHADAHHLRTVVIAGGCGAFTGAVVLIAGGIALDNAAIFDNRPGLLLPGTAADVVGVTLIPAGIALIVPPVILSVVRDRRAEDITNWYPDINDRLDAYNHRGARLELLPYVSPHAIGLSGRF